MRYRIMAAWRVLRGEWTAQPPAPTITTTAGDWRLASGQGYNTSTVWWTPGA